MLRESVAASCACSSAGERGVICQPSRGGGGGGSCGGGGGGGGGSSGGGTVRAREHGETIGIADF